MLTSEGAELAGRAGGRTTGLQMRIFAICALLLLCDGFDLVAISYAAPYIVKEMTVAPDAMARLFASAIAGMMLGGIFLGPLGDRLGTRRVLATSTTLAAAGTLVVSVASDLNMLLAGRFLTGIALGGAMPAAFAITAHFAPFERRRTILSIVGVAYGLGGALAGVIAALHVPSRGWRFLFELGGVTTFTAGILVLALIPESPGYLLRRGATDKLRRLLERLPSSVRLESPAAGSAKRGPVRLLLSPDWRRLSLALWAASILTLMINYLLVSWLPSIIAAQSDHDQAGALGGMLFQAGAAFGGLLVGWFMDRLGALRVAVAASVILGLSTLGAAAITGSTDLLVPGCALIGFGAAATQGSINMLAVLGYPEMARVTGTAFLLSVGRIGAIMGPLVGGALLGSGLPIESFFLVATFAAAATGLILGLSLGGRRSGHALSGSQAE